MKILDETEIDKATLNSFKLAEWPDVDDSHFDDKELVDFDEKEHTFIAKTDSGHIAGYIKMRTEMGTCQIESLIVGKDFRNQGVAKNLVMKVEQTSKEMEIHKIWLETGIDWDARKLYEKLEYKEVAILKNHYAHRDFVLMEKFI